MSYLKKRAAKEALSFVEGDMTVGLGSGSTVNEFIKLLGEEVNRGLNIQAVPSSHKTEALAREVGIPLTHIPEGRLLDIAIDGADEVDEDCHLLKGGGGSLVREKLVAVAAKKLVIIIDKSKQVEKLGEFPLPVEVIPFGWQSTASRIADLGCTSVLRKKDDKTFISDNGNYILDCSCGVITDPKQMHDSLKQLVGVIETGLFPSMADYVLISSKSGVEIRTKQVRKIDE